MTPDVQLVLDRVLKATCPEDVFGKVDAGGLKKTYFGLVAILHPDHFTDAKDNAAVHAGFSKLTVLKSEADAKLTAGTYGQRNVAPPSPPPPPMDPIIVMVGKKKYTVKNVFMQGDLADLYHCEFGGKDVIFKLAQSAADNDLLENEAKMLKKLYPDTAKDEKFYRYLPKLQDSMMVRTKGMQRKANVLPKLDDYFSLAEVHKQHPVLDFRDVVWMFKRTLAAIGFIHKAGVVHGALVPSHVLVHPKTHGAKLVDWCYAVEKGHPIKAAVKTYKDFYAPEVYKKIPATPQTDIYMAAKCAVYLLGGNVTTMVMPKEVPGGVQGFLRACAIESQSKRPDDAWALHEEFDELLLKLVGKPTYRPLKMEPRK